LRKLRIPAEGSIFGLAFKVHDLPDDFLIGWIGGRAGTKSHMLPSETRNGQENDRQ
jgi:hypothetical protein